MILKKLISILLIISTLAIFTSCANGKSLPYYILKQKNTTEELLKEGNVSYTEKVEYYKNGETLSYEIYYELSENVAYAYNIVEKIGDYSLVAFDGDVYTIKNGQKCIVLFTNPTVSFFKFVAGYMNTDFPLDSGTKYQNYSKKENGYEIVEYFATITPQMASEIYATELKTENKIISIYKVSNGQTIESIEYYIENYAGERTFIAKRTFERSTQKQNLASLLPQTAEEVKVKVITPDNEFSYSIPVGVCVGFEDGDLNYTYYLDEEYTEEFKSEAFGEVTEDIVIYAK